MARVTTRVRVNATPNFIEVLGALLNTTPYTGVKRCEFSLLCENGPSHSPATAVSPIRG
jgi:hypothetical protein